MRASICLIVAGLCATACPQPDHGSVHPTRFAPTPRAGEFASELLGYRHEPVTRVVPGPSLRAFDGWCGLIITPAYRPPAEVVHMAHRSDGETWDTLSAEHTVAGQPVRVVQSMTMMVLSVGIADDLPTSLDEAKTLIPQLLRQVLQVGDLLDTGVYEMPGGFCGRQRFPPPDDEEWYTRKRNWTETLQWWLTDHELRAMCVEISPMPRAMVGPSLEESRDWFGRYSPGPYWGDIEFADEILRYEHVPVATKAARQAAEALDEWNETIVSPEFRPPGDVPRLMHLRDGEACDTICAEYRVDRRKVRIVQTHSVFTMEVELWGAPPTTPGMATQLAAETLRRALREDGRLYVYAHKINGIFCGAQPPRPLLPSGKPNLAETDWTDSVNWWMRGSTLRVRCAKMRPGSTKWADTSRQGSRDWFKLYEAEPEGQARGSRSGRHGRAGEPSRRGGPRGGSVPMLALPFLPALLCSNWALAQPLDPTGPTASESALVAQLLAYDYQPMTTEGPRSAAKDFDRWSQIVLSPRHQPPAASPRLVHFGGGDSYDALSVSYLVGGRRARVVQTLAIFSVDLQVEDELPTSLDGARRVVAALLGRVLRETHKLEVPLHEMDGGYCGKARLPRTADGSVDVHEVNWTDTVRLWVTSGRLLLRCAKVQPHPSGPLPATREWFRFYEPATEQ